MPPKRSRIDNGDESDMQESIKLMKEEILEKFEIHKNEISDQFKERIDKLEEQLPKANEKQPLQKEFVLKHTFTNISEMKADGDQDSVKEEHYGQNWYIWIMREKENLDFLLVVHKPKGDYLIKFEQELQISGGNDYFYHRKSIGSMRMRGEQGYKDNVFGTSSFFSWEELKNSCWKDNKLDVQIRVKILSTTGIGKPKAFDFGEANKEHSDVVLLVGNEKFYVLKRDLTRHSEPFTSMFSDKFKEGNASEIKIHEIDPHDFQNFLEVLHYYAKPDEHTVEGILLVNDQYNAENVRRKCEKFLIKRSNLPLKKKLELSSRFQLNALTDKCVSGITPHEYKALGRDGFLTQVSRDVAVALVERAATLL